MNDTFERARLAFGRVRRGWVVSLAGSEPRCATVSELVPRLGELREARMLLTAISEAVETYDPKREAVIVVESERAIDVLILRETGLRAVGGIDFVTSERRKGESLCVSLSLPERDTVRTSAGRTHPCRSGRMTFRGLSTSFKSILQREPP
jgi:hypothetical protein